MKHPDINERYALLCDEAKDTYCGKSVDFTGPDRIRRRCYVESAIISHGHGVCVLLWVPQVPDPSQRLINDWAYAYHRVEDSRIEWAVE